MPTLNGSCVQRCVCGWDLPLFFGFTFSRDVTSATEEAAKAAIAKATVTVVCPRCEHEWTLDPPTQDGGTLN